MKELIIIDNEVVEVKNILENTYGFTVELDNGQEYILFETHEQAGEAAREYWEDMAHNDRSEFICLVGEKNLVAWCLGEYAGPGSTQVKSLDEWLDLYLDVPEEQWASYDGYEIEGIQCNRNFLMEVFGDADLDKDYIVMYRVN